MKNQNISKAIIIVVTSLLAKYNYYCLCFQFAADFAEKTLFKTIMVRLLKSALQKEKDNFTSLLNDEILNVDNQLLQVERATNEVSGMSIFCSVEVKNTSIYFIFMYCV